MEYTLKDRFLLGGIAGALGVLIRDAFSYFAKLAGMAKFYFWQRSTNLFIEGKENINSLIGNTVGILADIIFGAMLGIIFVYFLKFTSHKSIIIKGWGFGLFAWLVFFGILMSNLPGAQETTPADALAHFSVFIGHSIYGIAMGFFVKILMNRYNLLSD